jgi:IstB-like ATP binding protein
MSNAACEAVIHEYCHELKLAAVVRDYPGLCRRARDGGWAYEDLLRELLEAEITNRHQSTARRLLREARFPDIKTFAQLDWAVLKGVSRPSSWNWRAASSSGAPRTQSWPARSAPARLTSRSRSEWKPRAGGCEFTSPAQRIWCRAWLRRATSGG